MSQIGQSGFALEWIADKNQHIFMRKTMHNSHWKRFSIEAWTEEEQKQNHINDVPLDLLLSFSIMNLHHAVRLSVLAKCSSIKLPWTTHSQTVVHH